MLIYEKIIVVKYVLTFIYRRMTGYFYIVMLRNMYICLLKEVELFLHNPVY